MTLPCNETKILLIGAGLRNIDLMIDTLNMVRAAIVFADDGAEGLRILARETPDLVICEPDLPDCSGTELCSLIRSDERLAGMPVVFAGASNGGIKAVFDALNAGADDYLAAHFDANHFLAKLVWLIEQRNADGIKKRQYDELRRRQLQTLEILKETSNVFRTISIDAALSATQPYRVIDQRIEVGLGMIAGLANLLQEQIETVGFWFETQSGQPHGAGSHRAPADLFEASMSI